MADAVDVRGVEVEHRPGRVLPGLLTNPAVGIPSEVILVERPLANVDRARGEVVIVVARVLRVEPADEVEIEVRIPVELDEVTGVRVVTGEALPEARLPSELDREARERRPIEVDVIQHALVNPSIKPSHQRKRVGFTLQSAFATASPKPRTASRVGSGSMTGASLPKSSWPTPKVARQRSSALRP